ncbi:hypothetical protein [Pantoea sp. BAV 3049]|uniref:hypothetical protein n=1 Tax=Pantoea sp. BAV 3049 TaxID=2654188 RepID=UPI00131A8E58|nr:hypothetical protein [Pantoea sp. BAV 3049]
MSRMTFIVDFPDGQEPAVSAATDILGGQLVSVSFSDIQEQWEWRKTDEEPPYDVEVLAQLSDDSIVISSCSAFVGWYHDEEDAHVVGWMRLPERMED